MNQFDQLNIPHFDGAGRRVYWVYFAPCDENDFNPGLGVHFVLAEREREHGPWLLDRPYFKVDGLFVHLLVHTLVAFQILSIPLKVRLLSVIDQFLDSI